MIRVTLDLIFCCCMAPASSTDDFLDLLGGGGELEGVGETSVAERISPILGFPTMRGSIALNYDRRSFLKCMPSAAAMILSVGSNA